MDTLPVELVEVILRYAYIGYHEIIYGITTCKLWNRLLYNEAFHTVRDIINGCASKLSRKNIYNAENQLRKELGVGYNGIRCNSIHLLQGFNSYRIELYAYTGYKAGHYVCIDADIHDHAYVTVYNDQHRFEDYSYFTKPFIMTKQANRQPYYAEKELLYKFIIHILCRICDIIGDKIECAT